MIISNIMNKSVIWLFAMFTIVLFSCNDLDNYSAPSGGIHGTIFDALSNEPVPLPVQGSTGVIINLIEQNTSATKSIDFYAKDDGTYENSQVFNGDYNVVVNGPFVQTAEKTVSVNGQSELNFSVIPFSRIEASASASGQIVTITYNVTKSSADFNVTEVYGYWNFAPDIDNSGSNYAAKVTVNAVAGTIVFDLGNNAIFKSNLYKINNNGNKLYFRIGAKTNGIVNYSKIMQLAL